ncbi:hypothetical protein ACFQZ4_38525 [Catellatospora coxensis]
MTAEAYDLQVGGEVTGRGRDEISAGWAGPRGPGIDLRTWPRSPRTGQPMMHCFTLWLPEQYRRRGPDLHAVSVFQWNDELYFKDPLPGLAQPVRHPQLQLADDGVDHLFAMVWLTHDELNGDRTDRPAAAADLADGERDIAAVMQRYGRFGGLWLLPREDPNAGVAPVAYPGDGDAYVDVPDLYDRFHDEHLGGTAMSANGIRDGVSPGTSRSTGWAACPTAATRTSRSTSKASSSAA